MQDPILNQPSAQRGSSSWLHRHAWIAAGLCVFAAWLDIRYWGLDYETRYVAYARAIIGAYGAAVAIACMLRPNCSIEKRFMAIIAMLICIAAAASALLMARLVKN
jgi:hypothetical protein